MYFLYVKSVCVHPDSNPVCSTRTLQHPALLPYLAQCSEVTPYLLVMEYCPLVRHILTITFIIFFLGTFFVWITHK